MRVKSPASRIIGALAGALIAGTLMARAGAGPELEVGASDAVTPGAGGAAPVEDARGGMGSSGDRAGGQQQVGGDSGGEGRGVPAGAAGALPALPAPVPGSVLSDRIANYTIDVRLDPKEKRLNGREIITWTNRSPDPVSEIQLHLYWNAFKNQLSSFLREMGPRGLRGAASDYQYGKEDWGFVDVTSIRSAGIELKDGLEFIHPDDDNRFDQTVARVPLPAPVEPGATATFEVAFAAKVPRLIARAGFEKDYFLIGQWFPKLGVLEHSDATGTTAWNCHQYHAFSEFYSDFGVYDVGLTVPSEYKVGATGVRTGEKRNPDGTTTYRYHQADVIDFAWTAWTDYLEIDAPFEEPGFPKVNLHVMVPIEQVSSIDPIVEAAKDGLRGFGEMMFPYPYPQLTIVTPPYNAGEAGGMEYPTFITAWGALHPDAQAHGIRETVVHELAHQYWQSMLASNESEEPWLDEGFNTYGTAKVMQAGGIEPRAIVLGPVLDWPIVFGSVLVDEYDLVRAALHLPISSPLLTEAWKFRNGFEYGASSYARTAVVMKALELYLGPPVMAEIMKRYARKFAFHHPSSEDFFAVAEEVSGQELGWFFEQFVKGTEIVDYAVSSISVETLGDEDGYVDVDGKRVLNDGDAVKKLRGMAGSSQKLYLSTVEVERVKSAWFPVTLKVIFEDGSSALERWDGKSRWERFRYEGTKKVVSAEIDPEHRMWLDADRLNNGRTVKADPLPAGRLAALLLNVGQLLASMVGALV